MFRIRCKKCQAIVVVVEQVRVREGEEVFVNEPTLTEDGCPGKTHKGCELGGEFERVA